LLYRTPCQSCVNHLHGEHDSGNCSTLGPTPGQVVITGTFTLNKKNGEREVE